MPTAWDIGDLQGWDVRVREVEEFGLDATRRNSGPRPQPDARLHGVPARRRTIRTGRTASRSKLKTLYDHGVSGLPYEMVITQSRDRLSHARQFAPAADHHRACTGTTTFKNNFTFRTTRADYTVGTFRAHAQRIRAMWKTRASASSRGNILDAAHALSLQCRRTSQAS
jgi:stage V sporulation protein R